MFWNKKKKIEETRKLNEVQLLLQEIGLFNLDNLIKKVLAVQEDIKKQEVKKVLEYVKPYILKALEKNELSGSTDHILISEPLPYLPYDYIDSLKKEGLQIVRNSLIEDYSQTPSVTLSPTNGYQYKYYPQLPVEKQTHWLSFKILKESERTNKY